MMLDYSRPYAQGSVRRPLHMLARSTLQKARLVLAVLGAMSVFLVALPTQAGELEYQDCVRQLCSTDGVDKAICAQQCLRDLNAPPPVNRLPPIPILYGAIAIDPQTLMSGMAKGCLLYTSIK